MTENTIQFENAIMKALDDFKRKLEQQRLFQVQNILLKELQKNVKNLKYCHSQEIENLSTEYETFYNASKGSGRSYEDIFNEKNLVDTYSAFEKFLFDCFYCIYSFFPKFLGSQINVSTSDLFVDENVELCKKNVIESKVTKLIQPKNIKDVINEFDRQFKIKIALENEKNILYEISKIRNIIIHNNSTINKIYLEEIRKNLKGKEKYQFNEEDNILEILENLIQELKDVSTKVCEKIANAIVKNSKYLENYHSSYSK